MGTPHFEVAQGYNRSLWHSRMDVQGLQNLLSHDNLELRARMIDFMKDEIYIP